MSQCRVPLATLIAVVLILALGPPGCSRIRLAYEAADLLLIHYADGYLDLSSDQRSRWEPELQRALALHRRDELPLLAAFFDRALQVSAGGFEPQEGACLVTSLRELYRRHARLAVALASPLLADLEPAQVRGLEARFSEDLSKDRSRRRAGETELRERTRRLTKTIKGWTGSLTSAQRQLAQDLARSLPEISDSALDYRTRKRSELLELLRSGARAPQIQTFLTEWLVEYRDLPPDLTRAAARWQEGMVQLLSRLGPSLSDDQMAHLEQRLAALRADLLKLQGAPRPTALPC